MCLLRSLSVLLLLAASASSFLLHSHRFSARDDLKSRASPPSSVLKQILDDVTTHLVEELPLPSQSQARSDDSSKDVLVVGASGRSGPEVVKQLKEAGYKVRALVRTVDAALVDRLGPDVAYYEGDYSDPVLFFDALAGASRIVWLGDSTSDRSDPEKLLRSWAPTPLRDDDAESHLASLHLLRTAMRQAQADRGFKSGTTNLFDFSKKAHETVWHIEDNGLPYHLWNYQQKRSSIVNWLEHSWFGRPLAGGEAVFRGTTTNTFRATGIWTSPLRVDLSEFDGLEIDCTSLRGLFDYRLIIRTPSYWADGIQYEAPFQASVTPRHVLVPFSKFEPHFRGRSLAKRTDPSVSPETIFVDPSQIVQLGIEYRKSNPRMQKEAHGIVIRTIDAFKRDPSWRVVMVSSSRLEEECNKAQFDWAKMNFYDSNLQDPRFYDKLDAYQSACKELITGDCASVQPTVLRVTELSDEDEGGEFELVQSKRSRGWDADGEVEYKVPRRVLAEQIVKALSDKQIAARPHWFVEPKGGANVPSRERLDENDEILSAVN
uniref:Rhodanese domain-containing protein n=1 Tax=Chromera velia CCMP2878 TaxID=1169474 RepID=A0A0G4F5R7_9ALVE|mmetsp:Transcript_17687/g.35908  ORF Transcript_17687/g.35908 Transcript_17687/m.35908 type:complete len:546 (-) Transcript_17687:448-2085(-)|eukprot:Cvel_15374.t1-p1 / transcript=Cvel_15374.t1 / gene=Cvel_15374 / organism=Chromera_velia_CCMP2878 / gene_product=hypothetical protein / transcript_product=hypothetical protein / location=Cvel_scaffold1133:47081-48715(-) / protein_length=545 / sequence_SO=supercontig / SO=protein_coding / is_pseudo=false